MNWKLIFPVVLLAAMSACKKDKDDTKVESTGMLHLKMHHFWDTDSLQLGTQRVHPITSDTFEFTTFKYYVSNIRLKNSDGSWYSVPESYYLLDLNTGNTASISINNVPTGTYTDISLMFGVDSLRNVSGAQTGALSTVNGMFWSWNTGYIMMKAEGISPNSSSGSFAFHLGGFQGTNSVIKTKTFNLSGIANSVISETSHGKIGLNINAAAMWNSSPNLATVSDLQMAGAAANTMATDFVNGWTLSYVNN
ncbi:MAG: MbnP family protein [Fluviicola sp.]|jgi:hypothetical protein